VFSSGVLLFEMLTGRAAFNGPSAIETLNAILHEHPPALTGGLAIVDADRVIQRALMKAPSERYQSAGDMARDLKTCLARTDLSNAVSVRVATRLMVLPFRMLRPDPAIDFLAFSLPDAITVSLSGLESLIVRSSLVASRYGGDPPNLATLAHEAAIDAVVTGSLLQAGGLVRVNVQLIEVPSGTVLWSHAAQVPVDDMFQVQDAVCSAVVEALALPLSSREQRMLRRDVPAGSEAYAHYLRANRLSATSSQWAAAVESYQRAVEADPAYAPAWARYGRCLRIMSKYGQTADAAVWRREADEAIQRAFRINPDLSLAHHLYTHFEVDAGRASDAMLRLLGRVRHCATDPELFAGLVHACRYVGLLDASLAAHDRAVRLDPSIRTSVAHTHFLAGDFERAIALDVDDPPYLSALALVALERGAEALDLCERAMTHPPANEHLMFLMKSIRAYLTGECAAARESIDRLQGEFPAFSDPEGLYYWAQVSAGLGDSAGALTMLSRAVETGLHSVSAYEQNPVLKRLHPSSALADIIERARVQQNAAARAFVEADGPRLLGIS
jgi:TolB-like protein/tetratricopeptide (TPR) repeat protein